MAGNGLSELKQYNQWVGWNAEQRSGKLAKIPKNPHTGKNASSIDPVTWSDAQTAWGAHRRYNWSGVGFVFTIKTGVVGVDLDHCFTEQGPPYLQDWALQVVQCLDSYTEYSPSGQGLHIFCRGTILNSINKSKRGFEMYNEARYFTVTNKPFGGDDYKIEERSKELAALYVVFADEVIPEERRPPSGVRKEVDAAEMARALDCIPRQGDYFDWLKVLMAIHDAFPGDEGVRIAENWSPGYRGEVTRKFNSFDRTAKNGVTVATLFHMATQSGYQPQGKKKKQTGRAGKGGGVDITDTLRNRGVRHGTIKVSK